MQSEPNELERRLEEAERENAALRAENAALLDSQLASWTTIVRDESSALTQVYSTLSWRITKPLRDARAFQLAVRRVGLSSALAIAVARVRRRRG